MLPLEGGQGQREDKDTAVNPVLSSASLFWQKNEGELDNEIVMRKEDRQ